MGKFGGTTKLIAIVCQFHDGMMARVLDNGEPSEAFPVTNGVKHGCDLAPTLFSTMPGIRYRTDGKLFNPKRLQAVTKVGETVVRDFQAVR